MVFQKASLGIFEISVPYKQQRQKPRSYQLQTHHCDSLGDSHDD